MITELPCTVEADSACNLRLQREPLPEPDATAALNPALPIQNAFDESAPQDESKPDEMTGAAATAHSKNGQPLTAEELCSAFSGPIRRVPTTGPYRGAMLAVAVVMVLLPCVYIALTGAAGLWVYHYTAHILPPLLTVSRSIFAMAMVVAPTVVGSVIVLFMLKPLLAGRGRRMHPVKLRTQAEPRLHAFIEKLCSIVGAPTPSQIEVDCNVNASASLRGGLRGFFTGEMTLTIGLPLVSGLSLRGFTGVLAHEFGHFAQGGAMRVAYVIRSVNAWFFRVVYERDRLDEWLAQSMFTGMAALSVIGVIANLGVWFSRLILKTLMYLGHAVSSYLLRQMEYDADSCEARVVGSEVCATTTRRIAVLTRTADDLRIDVISQWQGTLHLPDDFPALFARRLGCVKPAQQEHIESELLAEKPCWADSHPTASQRITAAQKAAEPGIFALPGAAVEIFDHFGPLSQAVSLAHYEDDLDLLVNPNLLDPVGQIIGNCR